MRDNIKKLQKNDDLKKKDPSLFFERKPEAQYIKEWTESLTIEHLSESAEDWFTVMIFRIKEEWLALSIICFKEVFRLRPIRPIPHRIGSIFQGLVNLNGELELAISLEALLQIEPSPQSAHSTLPRMLMIAIENKGERWVFPINEVDGIFRLNLKEVENIPAIALTASSNYFRGMFKIKEKTVGLLDENLLFAGLTRSI